MTTKKKKTKEKKKEIRERVESYLELEGDASSTITSLKNKMKEHGKKGYFKFDIEKDTERDYGCSDGYDVWYLYGTRLETDDELAKRIEDTKIRTMAAKKAAKTKAKKKAERELRQYLKLHAKYKGKI